MSNPNQKYESDRFNVFLRADPARYIVLFNSDTGSYQNIPNANAVADALNGVGPSEQSKIDRITSKIIDAHMTSDCIHDKEYDKILKIIDREGGNKWDTGELGRDEEFVRVSEQSKVDRIKDEILKCDGSWVRYGKPDKYKEVLEIIDRISKEQCA